jgi:DNA-binding transcriptional LysR family regulator
VAPHLPALFDRYPALNVELELTERVVDPLAERFDLVIRIGDQPDSALVSRRIGSQRYVMGASPAYLRRHGTPQRMADLAAHRLIDWRQPPQFALESNDCDTRRLCAARGLGIALMPNWAIGEDLAAGRIVELRLQDAPPAEVSGIHLLRPGGRANAKVRAFTEHLLLSIGSAAGWVGAAVPEARGAVAEPVAPLAAH